MSQKFTFYIFALFVSLFSIGQTPYAHYPLDGNANDISGNNLNGTLNGSPAPTTNRLNVANKAMVFDGSGDYIALPVEFDFATMTVIVWCKATSLSGVTAVYSCDNSTLQNGQQKIILDPNNGNNTLRLRSGSAAWDQSFNLNQWYQIAFVRTPTRVKFFVNGSLVSTVNNPTNTQFIGSNNFATIGAGYTLSNFFTGSIDDLLIYNSALTDVELTYNYTSIKEEKELSDKLNAFSKSGIIYSNIESEMLADVKSINVFDLSGRIINYSNAVIGEMALNSTILSPGVYVVSFVNKEGNKVLSRKVSVKQ
jgi:hypothetical protein